jgi:hypothetical protein
MAHLLEQKQVAITGNNKANLERAIDSFGSNASSNKQDRYYLRKILKSSFSQNWSFGKSSKL